MIAGIDWIRVAEVSGSGVAALATVWGAWSKLWLARMRPWLRRRQARHNIVRNCLVFNRTVVLLQQWCAELGAMRALCISASNCGSHWDTSKPLTIDIVAEAAGTSGVPRVFARWADWRADPPYRQMLWHVVQARERGIILVTSEMDPSVLRDYYEEQGVCAAVVFAVTVTADAELIFMSLNFGEPPAAGGKLAKTTIEQHVGEARTLYRRAEAVRSLARQGLAVWRGQ